MNLTCKFQHRIHCKDGKRRNYLSIYLDNILLLKQKIPFDELYESGFDKVTSIYNIYLLNGKIYQTRSKDGKVRQVSFPVSKKRLNQGVDNTIKYEVDETQSNTVLNQTDVAECL